MKFGNGIQFRSNKEADKFLQSNRQMLINLQKEAETVPGVVYSEIWLNGNSPSFVVGLDDQDLHFVCFKL